MATLSKHDLDMGLRRLGELAVARGIELELVVIGGAAMVLGFEAREATKDVDVVIRAPAAAIVRQLAADLADELGWPTDWLNDAAKGFVGQPSPGPILLEAPGIVARTVSVHHLLALKLAAWRDDVDIDDARLLLRNCPQEVSRDALWNRVEAFVPRGREQTAWYAFLDLWEEIHGAD
jgi:predicted nucleotidyltransferase